MFATSVVSQHLRTNERRSAHTARCSGQNELENQGTRRQLHATLTGAAFRVAGSERERACTCYSRIERKLMWNSAGGTFQYQQRRTERTSRTRSPFKKARRAFISCRGDASTSARFQHGSRRPRHRDYRLLIVPVKLTNSAGALPLACPGNTGAQG